MTTFLRPDLTEQPAAVRRSIAPRPSGPDQWFHRLARAAGTATVTATSGLLSDTASISVPVKTASTDLSTLISGGAGGVITLPALTPATSTPSVTFALPLDIDVLTGSATSTVSIPSGTVITKVDGTNLDATTLSAGAVAAGALLNLDSVLRGSMQWGIPSIGLQFSQPISLSIFVGTGLNGQVVDVRRSITGTADWTTDGLVSATTTVVNGFANFETTKASFFAVTTPTPAPAAPAPVRRTGGGGGGGGGGGRVLGITPSTPMTPEQLLALGTPVTIVSNQGQVLGVAVFIFGRDLTVGIRNDDVRELQKFLMDDGHTIPAGATGFFGPQTRTAVIEFQKKHSLPQTGFVGPMTRGELNRGRGSASSESSDSGLTFAQANSIIDILKSFGIDEATMEQVRIALK